MKIAKFMTAIGTISMGAAIAYGLIWGNFGEDGGQLLANPWGIVSMVDLYVGFTLFSGWIVYREKSWWRSAIWIVLMMTLGFFTGSLYAFLALHSSGGDWRRFWLGKRMEERL